jgi:tetratricopeptide (TPR) repeat protein
MNILRATAIISLAWVGLLSQEPVRTPPQLFLAAKPQLDSHFASHEYKEAVKLLEGIAPDSIPEIKKDPNDPSVLLRSLTEAGAIQDIHVYMGRARVLSGDIEKAIDSFKLARQIAELKTAETEGLVNSQVPAWTQAIEHAKNRLKDIETLMKTKEELEAKTRRNSQERKDLEQLRGSAADLDLEASICKENITRGPLAIDQMKNALQMEVDEVARFASIISDLEASINNEKELISTNFGGDKAKYVDSVINTKENLENQKTPQDKIGFLNRLLWLDPNSADVQKQLAAVIGN